MRVARFKVAVAPGALRLPPAIPPSPAERAPAAVPQLVETVSTILETIQVPHEGKWLRLSQSQVRNFARLTYADGKTPVLSLDKNKRALMYDIVSSGFQLVKIQTEAARQARAEEEVKAQEGERKVQQVTIDPSAILDSYIKSLETILTEQKIEQSDLVFETPNFAKQKNQYLADMERSRRAISVMVGQDECPRCHSMSTTSVREQKRSADEPMTYIILCFACGKKSKS